MVDEFVYEYNPSTTVHLIDTPGFDDTTKTNSEVLKEIAAWLTITYSNNIKLDGIVYLHRIIDPRMQGSAKTSLKMLKDLCGPDAIKHVVLATTFWEQVGPEDGPKREQQLINTPEFWGQMCKMGCRVMRHTNDRASAIGILDVFVKKQSNKSKMVLELQTDMVDKGILLKDTQAGRDAAGEEALASAHEASEKELARMRADTKKAIEEHDQERAKVVKQNQEDLKKKMAFLDQEFENERAKLQRDFEAKVAGLEKENLALRATASKTSLPQPSKPTGKEPRIDASQPAPSLKQKNRILSSITGRSRDLLNAARSGKLPDVMDALQKGVHINTQDSEGLTPLALATKGGSRPIVEALLRHHADSNKADKLGNMPLHHATTHSHTAIVRDLLLLADNIEINQANKVGVNALHLAILKANVTIAQTLLNSGAQIDQTDMFDFTPLLYAVCLRHETLAILLLRHGADVNKRGSMPKKRPSLGQHQLHDFLLEHKPSASPRGSSGLTSALAGPLFAAVSMYDEKTTRRLLDAGANTESNMDVNRDRVLHRAIRQKQTTLVRTLLAHKANVDAANDDGYTPLHLALKSGQDDIIQLLISRNPDVNTVVTSGETPLHTAIEIGDIAIVQALLTRGAKIVSGNDEPLLHIAARGGHAAIIRLLLKHGAPVNEQLPLGSHDEGTRFRKRQGATPLFLAASHGHLEAAKLLVNGGADLQQGAWPKDCELHKSDQCLFASMSIWQCNVVHVAAAHGHQQLARFLTQKGGRLNAWIGTTWARYEDYKEKKILYLATEAKSLRVQRVQLLLNLGANINEKGDDEGRTALHSVAGSQRIDADENARVVKLLIEKGANVNAKDDRKKTPLHLAVETENRQLRVIEALIENGADPNVEDCHDWSPWNYANNSSNPMSESTIKILRSSSFKLKAPRSDGDTFTGNLMK